MDQELVADALQSISRGLEAILQYADLGYERVVLVKKQVGTVGETFIDLYTLDGETIKDPGYALGATATDDLRNACYSPGTGSWFSATITLHRDGILETDFEYDADPRESAPRMAIPFLVEALRSEVELYPRDPGKWPAWFMEKAAEFGVDVLT